MASNSTDDDNESNTFAGALGSIVRNIWDALCTLYENHIWNRNDVTVMYDLNPNDNGTGNGGIADGSMVNKPNASSIKLYAKTEGAIQHFAITDLDTSIPLLWYGCNPGSDPKNFTVKIYKNATSTSVGNLTARFVLKYGGHQCFDVWKQGFNYNVYTGSRGSSLSMHKYSRDYYWPKGVAKTVIDTTTTGTKGKSIDLTNEGIKFATSNFHALGVDENMGKMVTVVDTTATVWNLDKTNFNNSQKTNTTFKVASGTMQGACLSGNYLYIIYAMKAADMEIYCYDITTGQEKWGGKIDTSSITGNFEPEGIQVYQYNGKNTIFIGFNGGKGIWYFDS